MEKKTHNHIALAVEWPLLHIKQTPGKIYFEPIAIATTFEGKPTKQHDIDDHWINTIHFMVKLEPIQAIKKYISMKYEYMYSFYLN